LNARKKRLEKSIANNPVAKNTNNADNEAYKNRKNRKRKNTTPDESYMKKRRMDKKEEKKENGGNQRNKSQGRPGQFVRKPQSDEMDDYTGLTAKEGSQHKMRSNHKLKSQADVHRQHVKMEKKKSKNAMRLKQAARERIKLPKQKINKAPGKNKRKKFKPNNIRDILK
jgi:hypothetical protein